MRVFIDTNVLVYLFDRDAPKKQKRARELIEQHTLSGEVVLSTQVLQEFYVSVTRKLAEPLDSQRAYQAVKDFAALPLVQVDAPLILAAIQTSRQEQLSFWDALIIRAALEGGASVIYTEDLQHAREFDSLRIENPFH